MSEEFLKAAGQLEEVQAQFLAGKLVGVQHKDQREPALCEALDKLAQSFGVQLVTPIFVDSRGELPIQVKQEPLAPLGQPSVPQNAFGADFAALLSRYSPRTGVEPTAHLDPANTWCRMHHFMVEKMVLDHASAERSRERSQSFWPGLLITTLKGEIDTDEDGAERHTPAGTVGVLDHQSNPGQWSVHFGDAWVFLEESEMLDPEQYHLHHDGEASTDSKRPTER